MILTEDDARERWCPFVRGLVTVKNEDRLVLAVTSVNRDDDGGEVSSCIASRCMAWRWGQKPNPDYVPRHMMMSTIADDPRTAVPAFIPDETRGFCGLAVRPL